MAKTPAKTPEIPPGKTPGKTSKPTPKSAAPKAAKAAAPTALHAVWKSGDFKSQSRSSPPYNGLVIEAKSAVLPSGEMKAPVITITDHTNVATGVPVTLKPMQIADGWVPLPDAPAGSNHPKGSFTAQGALRLMRTTSGIYLDARLTFGEAPQQHVIGFLFSFGEVLKILPAQE